jgi:DNA-binding PadR family transcriptional regulator
MPPSRSGDLSASMAILGLVIQEPDTAAGVGARLVERFPRARWSRSVAHNDLPSLARQGLVLLVERGAKPSLDRYEATPAGVEQFREWLRASSMAPPMLRDALSAKLAFSEEPDLPGLLEAIREEERICVAEFEDAQMRLNAARRLGQLGPANGSDWAGRVQSAVMTDEAMMWGQRAKRLQCLRQELEEPEDDELEIRGGRGG